MITMLGNVWPALVEVGNGFIVGGGLRTTFFLSLWINLSQQELVQNLSKVIKNKNSQAYLAGSVENHKHKIDFTMPNNIIDQVSMQSS